MLKKIFCIALSLVTVFSCCGLSYVYGGITEKTVDSEAYKWTLCKSQDAFQNALLSSGIAEGTTAKNATINDLKKYENAADEEKASAGYGKVMFVAEYTDQSGNKNYVYLSGSDSETGIYAQNRATLGQQLKNAYSIAGFEPGADVFYTAYDPGVPWVKRMYTATYEEKVTGDWIGNQYAIRLGDGSNQLGKYFLSTLENIYAPAGAWGSKQYFFQFDRQTKNDYVVGNGLSYKYKNASGVYGRSKIDYYDYYLDGGGDLRGLSQTDYFYICFGGNGNSGTEQAKIGSKKAVIKTFNKGEFERDSTNNKNLTETRLWRLTRENFIGYTRNWSVTEYKGNPVLFSSVYFNDNDQFRIMDTIFKLANSTVYGTIAPPGYMNTVHGEITKAELEKMCDDHLIGCSKNDLYEDVSEMWMSVICNDYLNYFRERPGNVSSFGTDKDKGATMTAFYVYVGEKTTLTTTETIETVEKGNTRIMSSKEQIAAGSTMNVEEGGTLIIDGSVFCYGTINVNGGTLIVKGQLLNTYPNTYSYSVRTKGTFEKKNKTSIVANNGTIIVLEDALINLEMCYSEIKLNNSSMYTYGMVCNNGDDSIMNSVFVIGNEGVYVHGGTLRLSENHKNYTGGGLNTKQSSSNASKSFYFDFLRDTTPSDVSKDPSFAINQTSCSILGDLIMFDKMDSKYALSNDIKTLYKNII